MAGILGDGVMIRREQRKLVNNERLKLLATFVNGMGIATFAVGALAPLFSDLDGPTGIARVTAISSGICFIGACVLHYLASTILKGLRP